MQEDPRAPSKFTLVNWLNTAAVSIVMLLWGIHLGYPMHRLQDVRCTIVGYVVPVYYVFIVLLMTGAGAAALACKRHWSKWELLWWLLPLICLPGILISADRIWSARQWLSWIIRGVVPGGIIFLISCRKKSYFSLLNFIYPIIIAASVLGLVELYCGFNPLWITSSDSSPKASQPYVTSHGDLLAPIVGIAQPDNPFYRPYYRMSVSDRPWGTQGNRIPYASTILGFIPLGLWLLRYAKKFYLAHLAAVSILFSTILLSRARSSWVGLIAILVLMRIVGLLRNSREAFKILAGVLVCLSIFFMWPKTRDILLPRFESFQTSEKSIKERLEVLQTVKSLEHHFAFGVGFGQFPTACKQYYHGPVWNDTPDNQYLRWIIENGALGLLLAASFFIGLVCAGWREIQLIKDAKSADFYKSLLVGWLGVAVTFLFFDGFYWGACNMTFWIFLGLFATCLKFQENSCSGPVNFPDVN